VAKARRIKAGDVAGTLHPTGYIHIRVDGKNYQEHRLAWLYVHGKFPDNCIDHINGIKDDNRISNLRDVTTQENTSALLARKNKADSQPVGKTGVKGLSVYRQKRVDGTVRESYRAQIKENKKCKTKYFPLTPEGLKQAGRWYKKEYTRIYSEIL
jgi:hypothetical protein